MMFGTKGPFFSTTAYPEVNLFRRGFLASLPLRGKDGAGMKLYQSGPSCKAAWDTVEEQGDGSMASLLRGHSCLVM